MYWMPKLVRTATMFTMAISLMCCDSGGGDGNGGNGTDGGASSLTTDSEIAAHADEQFPFTPNQPIDVHFACVRSGSNLGWYFLLTPDGAMSVSFTTDTSEVFVFPGTYTYDNNQIRLQMPAGPTMPFPAGLDETSTALMPTLGMVGAFSTAQMLCVAGGHGHDGPATMALANYGCPTINVQAASFEDNVVEFVHQAIPTGMSVAGSVFRQRDVQIAGTTFPQVTRAYGIYRRSGNEWIANFRIPTDFADFIGSAPIVPAFEHNWLTGRFGANDNTVSVDQLTEDGTPCNLR